MTTDSTEVVAKIASKIACDETIVARMLKKSKIKEKKWSEVANRFFAIGGTDIADLAMTIDQHNTTINGRNDSCKPNLSAYDMDNLDDYEFNY